MASTFRPANFVANMNVGDPPPLFWVLGGGSRVRGHHSNQSTKILTETGRAHVTTGAKGKLVVLGNSTTHAIYWNTWKLSRLFSMLTGRRYRPRGTLVINVLAAMRVGALDLNRMANTLDPKIAYFNPRRIGALTLTVPLTFEDDRGREVTKNATFQIYKTGGISFTGLPHTRFLQMAMNKMLRIIRPFMLEPKEIEGERDPTPPAPPAPPPLLRGRGHPGPIDWEQLLAKQWDLPEATQIHAHPTLREVVIPPVQMPPRDPALPRPVYPWVSENEV